MFKIFLSNLLSALSVVIPAAGIGSFIAWLIIDVISGGCVWIAGALIVILIIGMVAWATYKDIKGE